MLILSHPPGPVGPGQKGRNMAEFSKVIKIAHDGYWERNDFPPYALASWDDRKRWTDYLMKINMELDTATASPQAPQAPGPGEKG